MSSVCVALPLDWTEQHYSSTVGPGLSAVLRAAGGPFDLVLGSDCIYYAHLYEPLIATVLAALGSGGGSLVLANDDSRTSAHTQAHSHSHTHICSAGEERWDSSFFQLLGQRLHYTRLVLQRASDLPSVQDGMSKTGGPYHIATAFPHTTHTTPATEGGGQREPVDD